MVNINRDDLQASVSIATLGSISILAASVLKAQEIKHIGEIFPAYLVAGILFLASSGAFLIYSSGYRKDRLLYHIYDFTFIGGIMLFFSAAVFTLVFYFNLIPS